MVNEVLEYLDPTPEKVFVDATLGGGGHTQALLEKSKIQSSKLKIYTFDQDSDAIEAAKQRLANYSNIVFIQDNFATLKKHVKEKVDGILFDLGISSYQINEAGRGFSLQNDGPLDMRMDKGQRLTAADIVNNYAGDELTRIFSEYGEERFAKRISNAIIAFRDPRPATRDSRLIRTTFQLKEIIEKAIPTWKKRESVTRIFQALRIAVNHELESLQKALDDAIELLKPGGRLVVISYHSLEDRIVKHTLRENAKNAILQLLTKKPVLAGEAELTANPRSRSAKLRAAQIL